MTDPVLSVRDLRVEFPSRRGTVTAVDRVSFEIGAGEVLGVVGESGAGKSVTGAAIIGLIEPPGFVAGGEVRFEGGRIDDLPPAAMRRIRGKRIGMVFQDSFASLDPLFRIGDQLVETITAHEPMPDAAARQQALRALSEVGIPAPAERIDNYPHQLSGGMRQRVVLALALAPAPALLIADEPTTALDVSVQAQIIVLIRRLCRQRGTAVMLITHDMGVIADAADRVGVMYAGRLVEIGPVGDVIQSPLHPYTQGLMGSIPALDSESERLPQIRGAMPRLTAIPQGCAFHPRCPKVLSRCASQQPGLQTRGASQIACWLHADAPAAAPSAP